MSDAETFPLVDPNDDGIRPAGKPDECLYCKRKVGQPHKHDCVIVTKLVRVRYIVELDIEVPHYYTQHDVEFARNDSSWCANNAIDELAAAFRGDGKECMCNSCRCEYLGESDPTPRRKVNVPETPDGEPSS
jgi:hypothetical protein